MDKYEEAIKILAKYNQDNIIKELERNNSELLIEQIMNINFEQLERLYNQAKNEKEYQEDKIEPIEYTNKIENEEEIEKIGEDIIRKGKYAVVTMAGGQRNKTRA